MTIGSKEHQDMIAAFERHMNATQIRCRFDKEAKDDWRKGRVYQDGHTNDHFRVYSAGYANARCVYMQEAAVV